MRTPPRASCPVWGAPLAAAVLVLGGCAAGGEQARSEPASAPTATSTAAPSTSAPSTPTPTDTPSTRPAPAEPTRVAIPALGIDEALIDLGLGDDGTLEVPEDPARVGWFTGGGRPGGPGPTVVVGHLDSVDGPAVFARLPELAEGDEVVMTSATGPQTYVVTEARDVPQDTFPTMEVFGASADDVLRLITCTGPYDAAAGRYTENRIVTARPAP